MPESDFLCKCKTIKFSVYVADRMMSVRLKGIDFREMILGSDNCISVPQFINCPVSQK